MLALLLWPCHGSVIFPSNEVHSSSSFFFVLLAVVGGGGGGVSMVVVGRSKDTSSSLGLEVVASSVVSVGGRNSCYCKSKHKATYYSTYYDDSVR